MYHLSSECEPLHAEVTVAVTTLIRGRFVLTSSDAGALRDAAVLVDGTTIGEVGPWAGLRSRNPGAEVVGDGSGIVLPGLVNTHGHFSEGLVTGMGETLTLFEWIQRLVAPVGPHLTREMARVGTLLKGAEMLQSGVTAVNDLFVCSPRPEDPVTPGVVDGLETLGIRGEVAFGAQDRNDPHPVDEIFAEHDALAAAAAASRRCRFRLGLATVLVQSPPLFAESVRRARDGGPARPHALPRGPRGGRRLPAGARRHDHRLRRSRRGCSTPRSWGHTASGSPTTTSACSRSTAFASRTTRWPT